MNVGPVLARHRRGLRNGDLDHRLLRLRRARDGRQHGARERARRDPREIRRQRVARDERPRAGQRGGPEPAAREQHVVVAGSARAQHVAVRVRRPHEARAHDRREIGRALEHDEFRRDLRRVDRRNALRERTAWGWRGDRRRARRRRPVAATCFATASMPVGGMNGCVHGPSSEFAISQPSYTFMKICGSDALFRISARVLITRWNDAAPGTGFQTGAPCDRHQDRGGAADDHARRIVLHGDRRRGVPRRGERRLQAVERDRARYARELRLQFGGVAGTPVGQRREVAARDRDPVEADGARHAVDARARARGDDAERRARGTGRLERDRAPEVDLVADPAGDLRRVDENRGVGERDRGAATHRPGSAPWRAVAAVPQRRPARRPRRPASAVRQGATLECSSMWAFGRRDAVAGSAAHRAKRGRDSTACAADRQGRP